MSMVKVFVEMDETWRWWLVPEGDRNYFNKPMTLEVPNELVAEFECAQHVFREVQEKLEQLYRIQEKLEPWPAQTIPEHKVIE